MSVRPVVVGSRPEIGGWAVGHDDRVVELPPRAERVPADVVAEFLRARGVDPGDFAEWRGGADDR